MNLKYLKRLIGYTAVSLLFLGSLSVSTTAKVQFSYTKLKVGFQPVRLHKPDGSISEAEFISEIILLPDGRANGGFGIWELSNRKLTLYHVVEGQRNGPFFTFKAERLSRVQSEVITFTFTVRTTQSSVPTGSVVFHFDGVRAGDPDQSIVFLATGEANEGCIGGRGCGAALPEFGFIRAEPQTVVVQSLTGNYTASFEHVTLVLSDDQAIGALYLGRNDGTVQQINIRSGNIGFRNGEAIGAWLHGTTTDSPLPVMIRVANEDLPSEPCRIYDILGTQGPVRLEARTRLANSQFRNSLIRPGYCPTNRAKGEESMIRKPLARLAVMAIVCGSLIMFAVGTARSQTKHVPVEEVSFTYGAVGTTAVFIKIPVGYSAKQFLADPIQALRQKGQDVPLSAEAPWREFAELFLKLTDPQKGESHAGRSPSGGSEILTYQIRLNGFVGGIRVAVADADNVKQPADRISVGEFQNNPVKTLRAHGVRIPAVDERAWKQLVDALRALQLAYAKPREPRSGKAGSPTP